MRIKTGVGQVQLQWGTIVVEPDQSTTLNAEVTNGGALPAAVIISPTENVSVTPIQQTADQFLITTSDTAPTTSSYVIASTRR